MSATPEQEPVATGTLAETPFGHLAIYLYRRTTSGTLVVTLDEGAQATVSFQQGRPVGARLPWPADALLEGLLPLCPLHEGEFSFFDGDLLAGADGAIAGVVDPYALLAASLEDHVREDMVGAVLERYRGLKLRLQPGRDLARLGLPVRDKPLIELIRAAPATPEELVEQSPLPAEHVRRVLYALIVTHMISLHEERNRETFRSQVEVRSGRPAFSTMTDAAGPGPSMPAWRQLVSLQPGAPTSARPSVKVSMPPLASARPAGATAPPRSPVAPLVSNPPQGMPPQAVSLAPEGDDAAARLRKAEHLVQRGRHDDALAVIDALLEAEPGRADLLALRGFALFDKHRSATDGLPRVVIDALKKALEIDPDDPRALYTRGLVYQRAGDAKKALASFKRVLQVDPKHIEAKREVQLAKLRKG